MKNTLLYTIEDWVSNNKNIFWKYEVSSYHPTYKLNVSNLPDPSNEDIRIMSSNRTFNITRMLNNAQKTQLCEIFKKAYTKEGKLSGPYVNVQIDYVKGAVIVAYI